jgi:hypothetical protein
MCGHVTAGRGGSQAGVAQRGATDLRRRGGRLGSRSGGQQVFAAGVEDWGPRRQVFVAGVGEERSRVLALARRRGRKSCIYCAQGGVFRIKSLKFCRSSSHRSIAIFGPHRTGNHHPSIRE